MLNWTKKQAKDFFVNYQMINTSSSHSVEDVFARLKMVQMDPLNVVGINPELVLQSRVRYYKTGDLYTHLYEKRNLIDGWEKQMSIYETKYFEHFKYVREKRSEGSINGSIHYRQLDPRPYLDEILDLFEEKGPLFSSNIKLGETKKHVWGSSKTSTAAIDYLWHKGLLGIESRRNTQKKYDLMSRVYNVTQENHFTNEDEFALWYLERRIQTIGFVWSKSTVHFDGYMIRSKPKREQLLNELLKQDKIVKVDIETIDGYFYIPKSALELPNNLQDKISFIAPLDQLTWDRVLLKKLFDFDYTWEVYTPVNKRKYGYYVLPILRKSDFIGKIEFEKQRGKDPLVIKSVQLEKRKMSKLVSLKLNTALSRFAKYLKTTIERIDFVEASRFI